MHQSLKEQQESFKKTLQSQTVAPKRIIHQPTEQPSTSTATVASANHSYTHLVPDQTETGAQRHLYSYIYSIIAYLKLVERPVSYEEIYKNLKIDLGNHPELLQNLDSNPKITHRSADKTLLYKPHFQVKSKSELLELLRTNSTEGVDYEELRDSYSKIDPIVDELLNSRLALALKSEKKESNFKILFYNEHPNVLPVDPEFKMLWNEIFLPHETDIQRELEAAGFKGLEVSYQPKKLKKASASDSKGSKRRRPVKITNVHLEGLVDFDSIQGSHH